MAAKESINSYQAEVESIVNRWLVDYYVFLSVELFKNEQYLDFCAIRDVLDHVLLRPLESTDIMPTKIRVLQFLSRINDGENLDLSFESDQLATPLESAIMLLERIRPEITIPQQEITNVITSIKEMLMVICIKKNEFEKAKEVLKHFPKGSKKALFTELIGQKRQKHEILEQITFQRFKEEMLEFCQKFCPFTVPFLYKAAKQLISKRVGTAEQEDQDGGPQPDEQDTFQITIQTVPCNQIIIQRTRLEAAYMALAVGSGVQTFAQLEEEMESEHQTEKRKENISLRLTVSPMKGTDVESQQDELFQRDSASPIEASPADQAPAVDAVPQSDAGPLSNATSPLRTRRQYTVAQLVMEPDSQGSSQCLITSNELETEVRPEEPEQALSPQCLTSRELETEVRPEEPEQALSPQCLTSRELETEVRPEEPEQALVHSDEEDLQSPVTDTEVIKPTRKRPRQSSKTCHKDSVGSSSSEEDDTHEPVATRKMCALKSLNQSKSSPSKDSAESKQLSSGSGEDPLGSVASVKTPVRKPRKRQGSKSLSSTGDVIIADCSLDSSPNQLSRSTPSKSSTPQKDSPQNKGDSYSKWKRLYNNAKESKDTWSDEESLFSSKTKNDVNKSTISNSGHKRKMWTDRETQMLKEAVEKFGEGNWSKIKAHYPFNDRTNVNLKDRWRTMKNLKLA